MSLSQSRKGGIIPLVAVLLLTILAVGGLAVDYARIQVARAELRAASDAVARSAATELVLSDSQSAALARGKLIATRYKVGGSTFKVADSDILFGQRVSVGSGKYSFAAGAFPPNAVQVQAKRANGSAAGTLGLFFGPIFGVKKAQVSVGSTASFRIVDICVVLDRSSSMKLSISDKANTFTLGDPRLSSPASSFPDCRWMALDAAAKAFLNLMDKSAGDEHVAIVTFASDYSGFGITSPATSIDMALSSDLTTAANTITKLSDSLWNGMTYIEAGVRNGTNVLTSLPGNRANAEKIMILLTDGYQNQGSVLPAAKDAAAAGIRINTISLGDYADQALMQQVADAGGGQFAHASDQTALTAIFAGLATSLTSLVE